MNTTQNIIVFFSVCVCDYSQDGKWAFPHSLKAVILENPSLFSVKDDWSRLHWSIKILNHKNLEPLP